MMSLLKSSERLSVCLLSLLHRCRTFVEAGEFCAVSCVYSFMRGEVYAVAAEGATPQAAPPPSTEATTAARRLSDGVRQGAVAAPKAAECAKSAPPAGLSLLPPAGAGSMCASSLLSSPLPRLAAPRVPAVQLQDAPEAAKPAEAERDEAEGGYDAEGEEENGASHSAAAPSQQSSEACAEHAEAAMDRERQDRPPTPVDTEPPCPQRPSTPSSANPSLRCVLWAVLPPLVAASQQALHHLPCGSYRPTLFSWQIGQGYALDTALELRESRRFITKYKAHICIFILFIIP